MDDVRLPSPDEPMFTVDEVAKRCHTSRKTLERWWREGRFPRPRKRYGRLFYTLADLAAIDMLWDRWRPMVKGEEVAPDEETIDESADQPDKKKRKLPESGNS